MKRILLLTVLLLIEGWANAQILQVGLGPNINGQHDLKVKYQDYDAYGHWDSAMGMSIYAESLEQHGNLLAGFGAAYLVPRAVEASDSGPKVGFVPFYVTGKIQAIGERNATPELLARAGYNLFMANDAYRGGAELHGGIYWGMGCALIINVLVLQLMYEEFRGGLTEEYQGDTIKGYATQSQISLSIGSRLY